MSTIYLSELGPIQEAKFRNMPPEQLALYDFEVKESREAEHACTPNNLCEDCYAYAAEDGEASEVAA